MFVLLYLGPPKTKIQDWVLQITSRIAVDPMLEREWFMSLVVPHPGTADDPSNLF